MDPLFSDSWIKEPELFLNILTLVVFSYIFINLKYMLYKLEVFNYTVSFRNRLFLENFFLISSLIFLMYSKTCKKWTKTLSRSFPGSLKNEVHRRRIKHVCFQSREPSVIRSAVSSKCLLRAVFLQNWC